MDFNVSVFKGIDGLMHFKNYQKFVLSLFVVAPFTVIIANYSPYYLWKMEVLGSILAIIFYFLIGFNLRSKKNKRIVLNYLIIGLIAWGAPLLFHFKIPSVKLIVELLFACAFLVLRNDAKTWIYDKFIKLLALLFVFSIIEFLFAQFGRVYIIGETVRSGVVYQNSFYQTIFNLLPQYYLNGTARFQSITEEPGLVGTLCFFILSSMDMKKYKVQAIIFGLAGILSMSLAFYVLMFFWLILRFKSFTLKYILLFMLFSGTIYFVFSDRINDIIIERIVSKKNEGESLDNRNSEQVKKLFDETSNSFDRIICGMGNRTFEKMDTGASAGIKKIIVQYGFLMVLMALASFCLLFFKMKGYSYSSVVILMLFLFSLYQRFDLNLSTNIIVIFGSMLPFEGKISRIK